MTQQIKSVGVIGLGTMGAGIVEVFVKAGIPVVAVQNPTTSLQRNVETIQLLDRLGYDEVWVGEHHSAATEIIADPLATASWMPVFTSTSVISTWLSSVFDLSPTAPPNTPPTPPPLSRDLASE